MKKFIPLFFTAIIAFSCNPSKLELLNREINEVLLKNHDNKEFILVLDTISSFNWDEIIVVGPYVDLERVTAGTDYNLNAFPTTIKDFDSFVLIGFLNKKIGVKYIELEIETVSDNIFNDTSKGYKIYARENSNLKISKKH